MSYILLLTIHADPAMPPGYDEWGGTHTYMRELLDCFESFIHDMPYINLPDYTVLLANLCRKKIRCFVLS